MLEKLTSLGLGGQMLVIPGLLSGLRQVSPDTRQRRFLLHVVAKTQV